MSIHLLHWAQKINLPLNYLIMKPKFWERRGRVKLLIFHKVQRERAAINLASWEKQPEFTFRLRTVHKKRRYFTPNVLTLIITSLQLLEKKDMHIFNRQLCLPRYIQVGWKSTHSFWDYIDKMCLKSYNVQYILGGPNNTANL